MDDEQQYAAASSRDARFDGVFFTAVRTTGIYCRPSCPAMTPRRENVVFYPTAAAAQQAGFRACKRCRPDASPGSPEWNVRSDVAGRAMRLIAASSLIENLPALVEAAARGLAGANLTVLNGTQGVNEVVAGLVGQGISILDLLRKSAVTPQAPSANGTAAAALDKIA